MRLDIAAIEKISSAYLDGERKNESWQIITIDVSDDRANAQVAMRDYCLSGTDVEGFHLSYITALEFVSQLQIIFMHVWSGLAEKTQEAWMVECSMKSHRPIRNPEMIQVEMTSQRIRRRGELCYCTALHRVTDDHDGLFEIWIKALMK